MLSPKFFLLSLVLLFGFQLYGQQRQVVVPPQLEDKVVTNSLGQDIQFYSYPYQSERIDLRSFKRKFPNLDIPDIVMIQAPDFTGFRDSTILLSIIKGRRGKSDALIIWVAGNYKTNKVTFFIDKNLDRNFHNDGEPLILSHEDEPYKVELNLKKDRAISPVLWLSVPEKLDPKIVFLNSLKNRKAKIKDQFSISFLAGFGPGNLSFEFDNLEHGFPTWYDVNVTEKQIGVTVSYDMHRFRLGASVMLQNLYHYTSYLNTRLKEPEIFIDPSSGLRTKVENVLVERNRDIHAANRIQWSLMAAMRLFLGEFTELQPTISGGITTHLASGYVNNREFEDQFFNYKSSPFVELGLQLEITTSAYKAFFVGIAVNHLWWEPEGYFESFQLENLQRKFLIYKGVFGYRIAIR